MSFYPRQIILSEIIKHYLRDRPKSTPTKKALKIKNNPTHKPSKIKKKSILDKFSK